MSQTAEVYRLRTEVQESEWEPFLLADGTQLGEVAWLRKTGSDGRTLMAGMWRKEPSTFPYPFGLHETFVMTKGVLRIRLDDGSEEEYGPGDIGSYVMGTNSTWTVVEPVEHLFVVND